MRLITFARRTGPIWNMMSGVVATLGIVAAGWAIWQYTAQKEAERQKYTLELVEIWQEKGYLDSYDRLAGKVFSFMKDVPQAQLDNASRDPNLKLRLQENFTRRVSMDADSLQDVKRVVYFFKWLSICLESELCSQDAARAFFDDTVGTFVQSYGKYIEVEQTRLPAPLILLEDLSRMLNMDRPL